MRGLWAAAIIAMMASQPAGAFSGAEFLDTDHDFSDGYAWGALEARLMFIGAETESGRQAQLWDCIGGANISSNIFGDAVRTEIEGNAKLLTDPAIRAVILTINAMCPDE